MSDETNETAAATESAVTTKTEVAPAAVIDKPAVAADESASPFSDLPLNSPANSSPSPAEPTKAGGGFDSPFVPPPAGLSMIERLERLEKIVLK